MSLHSIRPIPSSLKRGKQQVVINTLTRFARKLGPGAKLPTSRELANALGITGATLTRCLERMETRGILRCLQGSGIYVNDSIMQRRVALVFGEDIFSPSASQFGALMLKHCSQRAENRNERFSFFLDTSTSAGVMNGVSVPAHQDLVDTLKDGKLDGIILMIRNSVEQEAWIRSQGVPVVAARASFEGFVSGWDTVIFDYQQLFDLGVNRLLKTGVKTVGFFGILEEHRNMFRKTAKKYGIPFKDEWVICSGRYAPNRVNEQFGAQWAAEFLDKNRWNPKSKRSSTLPDALLISDDMTSVGALRVFTKRGVVIGKDIKICSHKNKDSVILREWDTYIQTVMFDPESMAVGLLEMLEILMDGKRFASPHLIGPIREE